MARTAYCKRCGKEVEAGEMCPFCGTRLGKNAVHAAWCVERNPVKDWMYWNSVMRLLLPGALAILVLVLLLELVFGGIGAVEKMISSAFLPVLGVLLAVFHQFSSQLHFGIVFDEPALHPWVGVPLGDILHIDQESVKLFQHIGLRAADRVERRQPGPALAGKMHGAVLRAGLVAADPRDLHAFYLG